MKKIGLILALLMLSAFPASAIIFFDVDGDMIRLGGGGGGGVTHNATWVDTASNSSITIATSPTAGDTLVAWVVSDDNAANTITWPSGFTEVAKVTSGADAQTCAAAVKVNATGSEGNLGISISVNTIIGGISAFSGAHTTTQPDVTTVTATDGTAQATPWTLDAAITPVTNGNMIAAITCSDVTTSGDAVHTFSDTGGLTWTVRSDIASSGAFHNAAIGTAPQATAAATTVTATGTLAAHSAGQNLILISIRPQ